MLDFKKQLVDVGRTTLPISALIIILDVLLLEPSVTEFSSILLCCALIVLGFTLFLYGVDIGVIPMGIAIGSEMPKRNSVPFIIAVVFIISITVTIAEPDISVFSNMVCRVYSTVQFWPLVLSIAVGVGTFLVIAAMRLILNISLRLLLTIGYAVVIMLALITPEAFLGVAFDAGGVTTGPMTIPVLLAMGMGICITIASRNSMSGFGMIGLASIGPIIALLIYGMLIDPGQTTVATETLTNSNVGQLTILHQLLECTKDVLMAVGPLYIIFLIFQKYFLHYTWRDFRIMSIGIGIASFGIILFLTGVYAGFMPLADRLGEYMAKNDYGILILILGAVIGLLVIMAEPAVKILSTQVESASNGILTRRSITLVIAVGVAAFVGIGMYLLSIGAMSMYYLLPIYAIAIILVWFIDEDLVGITYDAGGVATGPMSVAVIMTMYAAIAETVYSGSGTVHAFGAVALIALAPIISLSILGLITRRNKNKKKNDNTKDQI